MEMTASLRTKRSLKLIVSSLSSAINRACANGGSFAADGFMELKPGSVRKGPKLACPGPPKGPTPQKTSKRSRSHKRKSVKATSQVPDELADPPKKDHDPKKPSVNVNTLGEAASTLERSGEEEVASPRSLPKTSQLHRRTRSLSMLTPSPAPHMTPCNVCFSIAFASLKFNNRVSVCSRVLGFHLCNIYHIY
jgi:hypothetical protein